MNREDAQPQFIPKKLILLISRNTRCIATILCFFAVQSAVYAQREKANKTGRNTIYADFASKGAYYSINYDRVFRRGEKLSWSYRVGFSILKDAIAVPLGIHLFTGRYAHHAEFSITGVPYVEKYTKLFSSGNLSDKKIYVIPGTGYRYQKKEGGFFCRVVVSPLIYLDPPSDDFWNMESKLYLGINGGVGISF